MSANAMQSGNSCCAPSANAKREGRTFVPSVDVLETKEEVRLLIDLPGADPAQISVEHDRGRLTVFAPVKARNEGGQWLAREYGVGDYERAFEVGEQIDAAKIQAEFDQGVLTLHLPKAEQARSRRVEVKSA